MEIGEKISEDLRIARERIIIVCNIGHTTHTAIIILIVVICKKRIIILIIVVILKKINILSWLSKRIIIIYYFIGGVVEIGEKISEDLRIARERRDLYVT